MIPSFLTAAKRTCQALRHPASLRAACAAIAMVAATLAGPAHAQPSGARGDDFIYRVMRNDTLIDLATRFTGTTNHWSRLQQINQVADPTRLPIGLELRIPFELIPEVPGQADVVHAAGDASVNGAAVQPGATLKEGDAVQTGAGGFLTFRLEDGSLSAVPANARLAVQRLRSFMGTGLVDVILDLQHGAVESAVAPENTGTGRYEIRTPVSITGVRGTQLRVRAGSDGAQSEVLSGSAQLGPQQADGPLLQSNQGTAVRPDGTVLPVRALPAAPVIDPESAATRELWFEPVAEATGYLVRVSADAQGLRPVMTRHSEGPPVAFHAPGPGTWWVSVRAIGPTGLMSPDATLAFEGQGMLRSGFGQPVMAGHGSPVLLTAY